MAFVRSPDGISIELLQKGDACLRRNPGLRWPIRESGDMAAFVVVQVNVNDPERYESYKKMVPPSLEPYGGRFRGPGRPG